MKVWWRWKGKEVGGEEEEVRGEGCSLLVGFDWGRGDAQMKAVFWMRRGCTTREYPYPR